MVSLGALDIKPIISGSLGLKVLNTFPETLTFLLPPSLPPSALSLCYFRNIFWKGVCIYVEGLVESGVNVIKQEGH